MNDKSDYEIIHEKLLKPFYYLFKINSARCITVMDMADILVLAKETLCAVAKQLEDNTFSDKIIDDAFDLFNEALNVHILDSSFVDTARYDFDIRVIKYTVRTLFDWFEHCSADKIYELNAIFDILGDELMILYLDTGTEWDAHEIFKYKELLNTMCPVHKSASSDQISFNIEECSLKSDDNSFFGI